MEICKDEIIEYLLKNTSDEPELLQELRRETNLKCINSIMISGELQGRLLSLISKIKKPKQILEIGTFTGYSALCLTEGLKKGGEIHTIDKNEELLQIQNKYFKKSNYRDNIFQYTMDASIMLEKMNKKFDIIFLDADKKNYVNYLNYIPNILNKNGILIADNVLWYGKVLGKISEMDIETKAINQFNKKLKNSKQLQTIILPLRDGISISIKL
jgi:predicted O-methyltransferase YrrM